MRLFFDGFFLPADHPYGYRAGPKGVKLLDPGQILYIVLADKQWGMVKMNQQFTLKPLKTLG